MDIMYDKKLLITNLNNIYQNLLDIDDYYEIATNHLNDLGISNIAYILYNADNYDSDDKVIVELIVKISQIIYNNSGFNPPLTDDEYDKMYELNLILNDEEIVGGPLNATDKIIAYHKYPDLRGTLDKVHFFRIKDKGKDKRKSLEDWKRSVENKLGRPLRGKETVIHIFPKWDGISVIFECNEMDEVEKVLSRGDTDKNEALDLTAMFKNTKFQKRYDDNNSEYGMKTEVIMSEENYTELCNKEGDFKSPRSAVSSIFNSKVLDPKYLKYLTVVPLQIQRFDTKEIKIAEESYQLYPYIVCVLNNDEDFDIIESEILRLRRLIQENYGLPIDGAVIRLVDPYIQKVLGREGRINKYEVAYKYPPLEKRSIVKEIEFSVGVLGAITPVAKIEPVKMKGNKISSISLGSIDRFNLLNLAPGDEVIVKYEIIPYLTVDETCQKSGATPFELPENCPYCGKPLMKDPILKCTNNDCDFRKIGKIINYIEKMRIANIDISTVTTFFKHKFLKSIEDLYKLNDYKDSIINLKGFGERSFAKIIDGVNCRKNVYDYELLGSMGIPDIGNKIFKKILNIYYIQDLIQICINNEVGKLTIIGGVGGKNADKIIKGIKLNIDLINFLCSTLNVQRDERKYTLKVCFTKIRDKDFEKYLDHKDVLILDNYSQQLDLLIVPSKDVESSKVEKALKDKQKGRTKLEIVTIEDAYRMFGYKGNG